MTIDLKGTWKLSALNADTIAGAEHVADVPFALPGDIHSALLAAGIIADPYYGTNELDIQWVGKTDWCAVRTVTVTKNFLRGKQYITLHSADTFVRVMVNGKEVGFCTNFFRAWRFDVSELLVEGENTVELVFESAERHALEEAARLTYPIPATSAPVDSPHRNLVRKQQCHGGWDWGPCIMAFGVYESITLEQTTSGFIDYVEATTTRLDEETWNVAVTVTYTALKAGTKQFTVDLTEEKGTRCNEEAETQSDEPENKSSPTTEVATNPDAEADNCATHAEAKPAITAQSAPTTPRAHGTPYSKTGLMHKIALMEEIGFAHNLCKESASHSPESFTTTQALNTQSHSTETETTVQSPCTDTEAAPAQRTFVPIQTTFTAHLSEGENRITHNFTVKNPELWYVSGTRPEDTAVIHAHGEPTLNENTLYRLTVANGKTAKTKKIAFRTLNVVNTEDEHGKSLYFVVNGRPVFAKGSNWIPCDALPARQTYAKYNKLLSDLVKANGNCVRVWGGGRYEHEWFYELCDKKGILVWQDCMFACSLYPSTKDFLQNVRAEIRHQVRRLQSHACIALWCGNNETLGAFGWYEESKANLPRYLVDYDRLNEGVLADEITALDAGRTWWPSSPSAGPNDFSDNWHTDGRGDMHYWSVWHEGKPFSAYYDITPRFVSEFGYQSFPSIKTVSTYAPTDEHNLTSPVMDFHQCNKRGNAIIIENFARYYRMPDGFENMLYLSQVQQAVAIQTAIDYWRSLRPVCMGSLIWQLNDVWPVASWSSIEYGGKWKLLHYNAKRFFAPLHLSLYAKNGTVYAYAINDTQKTATADCTIRCIDFDGNTLNEFCKSAHAKADSAECVFAIPETELPQNCFLHARWGDFAESTLFPNAPKTYALQKPNITLSVRELLPNTAQNGKTTNKTVNGAQRFEVTLTTQKPAFYVSLDSSALSGTFSQNMFTLLPNVSKTVIFTAEEHITVSGKAEQVRPIPLSRFERALTVTSLRDTYR